MAGNRGDALLVRLHSPPVDRAANDELIALIARLFDLPKRAVAGARSRQKRIRVIGIDAATAALRIADRGAY